MSVGKLVKVNQTIGDSTSNTISVTGIDSDNDYIVVARNLVTTYSSSSCYARVTKSGSQDSTTNYVHTSTLINTNGAKAQVNSSSASLLEVFSSQITGTGISDCGVFWLKKFNSSSDYSYILWQTIRGFVPQTWYGTGVHKVTSSSDGFGLVLNAGNFATGSQLTLYKVL
jgi:hypothetical protein